MTTDELVVIFGEEHRNLIEDVLKWLDQKEPVWGVKLNRQEFVKDLISRITKK